MSVEKARALKEFLTEIAEGILALKRAMQGLPISPETFSGLINPKDIRERTRLNRYDVHGHTLMRLLTKVGGSEWGIWGKIADEEDHYFISEKGLGRTEGIEMLKAKSQEKSIGAVVSLTPAQKEKEKEGKKHFWSREKKEVD